MVLRLEFRFEKWLKFRYNDKNIAEKRNTGCVKHQGMFIKCGTIEIERGTECGD